MDNHGLLKLERAQRRLQAWQRRDEAVSKLRRDMARRRAALDDEYARKFKEIDHHLRRERDVIDHDIALRRAVLKRMETKQNA